MFFGGTKLLKTWLVLVLGSLAWSARAQQNPDSFFDKNEIKPIRVTDGFYYLEGSGEKPGGNISVSVGSDGLLLVDSQYAPLHQRTMDALAKISNQPIRFLINTHWHIDHAGGNALMAKAGVVIIAHDNVAKRLREGMLKPGVGPGSPPAPKEAIPIITYSESLTLHFNGEEISVLYAGPAHTDGDSIVYFHNANIVATGDIPAANRSYGIHDLPSGGSVNGNIAALERFLKMGNATTRFLPGHGGFYTAKDIQEHHDMLVAIRDRVLNGIRAGKTMEQVVASKPTADFDEKLKGTGNSDQFIANMYNDLSRK